MVAEQVFYVEHFDEDDENGRQRWAEGNAEAAKEKAAGYLGDNGQHSGQASFFLGEPGGNEVGFEGLNCQVEQEDVKGLLRPDGKSDDKGGDDGKNGADDGNEREYAGNETQENSQGNP